MPLSQVPIEHIDYTAQNFLAPTGSVMFFANTTVPTGWIKANGAAVSRTAYANLYTAIGTTWGTGDGSTTFNIPDLRGYFPRAHDDGVGRDSGRTFATSQTSQNKFESGFLWINPHDGGSNMGADSVNYGVGGATVPVQLNGTGYPDNYGSFGKYVGYLTPSSFSIDQSRGSVGNNYGKGYNTFYTFVGVGGDTYGGNATQNAESRPPNVNLLACVKY
jgi:hypothetical protein